MQVIVGDKVYSLGFLSDRAAYNQLRQVDFFAAFFDGGTRANNTPVNTALEAAVAVITSRDSQSPVQFVYFKSVMSLI